MSKKKSQQHHQKAENIQKELLQPRERMNRGRMVLLHQRSLQDAIIISEILGPPKSLRN